MIVSVSLEVRIRGYAYKVVEKDFRIWVEIFAFYQLLNIVMEPLRVISWRFESMEKIWLCLEEDVMRMG